LFVLDIRKLHMLAELDKLGTIAAVARSLGLTAPGISMQLAALERELGVKLTERQGRRVLVTPAGKVLSQHARDIGGMLAVAEMEVTALGEGTAGSYTVAAFPTAARSYVADAWKTLLADAQSGITLRLTEAEPTGSLAALAAGEVELAVAHAYSNAPHLQSAGLVAIPLATEKVLLAVRDDDPSGDIVDLAAFSHRDWILPHQKMACHEMVVRACGMAGFEPRSVAHATDFRVQLSLVRAGAGVALIPRLGATDVPDGVVLKQLKAPVLRHHFAVTRQSSAADAGLARVRQLVLNAAQALFAG